MPSDQLLAEDTFYSDSLLEMSFAPIYIKIFCFPWSNIVFIFFCLQVDSQSYNTADDTIPGPSVVYQEEGL